MEKQVPHNMEAESGVLGSILIDPQAIALVVDFLQPEDFYRNAHRTIFSAMLSLFERHAPPDLITLCDVLERHGKLAEVGGPAYIASLVNHVPTSMHVEHYGHIVSKSALHRRLIQVAGSIAALGFEEAEHALDTAEELIYGLGNRSIASEVSSAGTVFTEFFNQLEQLPTGGSVVGVPSGFYELDDMTRGFQRSDLIILAGRPAMGKTSLCLSIAANAAIPYGGGVLIFSCEMSKMQIIQRLTGMLSGVNVQHLFTRQINEDEMERVTAVGHTIDSASLWIDDTPALTISALRSKLRRTLAKYHIDLVIIDYLQLMQAMIDGKRIRDRLQEVSEVARGLKNAAREFNMPILALAQLSRAVEGRADKRPQLSDLRECVVGSTRLIEARTGKWVPIEQIRPGDEVLGLGKQQKIGRFPVEQVWRTGTKPVFRLTTRTGRQLIATADHRLLTVTGWKQLGEISSGEYIATAMRLPEHGQEMPERADLCRLLGYMLGDGAYLKHRTIGFASYDPEAFEDVSTLMQEKFPGVKAHSKPYVGEAHEAEFSYLYENGSDKPYVNPLRKWLRELGLIEQKDRCKHVPQWVFEAGKIGACQFLAGYLSSDGCIKRRVKDGRVIWEVRFDTVSRQLATDVQALLLRIGVIASIDRSKQKVKARQRLYHISLSSIADNLRRFAEQVPARGEKGRFLQQFLEEDPPIQIDPGVFALPPELSTYVAVRAGWRDLRKGMPRAICLEWAKQLKDPFLQEWGESDLLWEEVRSIELCRESAEVFDISVPGCKNFIADGIIAHNSGELEQAADVVMFIHRDDYYAGFDRETGKSLSTRPKTADIIIAKHRNGPIGDVMLGFEASQTKFYNLNEMKMED